jgi:hypothetical protein
MQRMLPGDSAARPTILSRLTALSTAASIDMSQAVRLSFSWRSEPTSPVAICIGFAAPRRDMCRTSPPRPRAPSTSWPEPRNARRQLRGSPVQPRDTLGRQLRGQIAPPTEPFPDRAGKVSLGASSPIRRVVSRRLQSVRGRDVRHRMPPAQIRTSGFPASGSYLGCLTAKRMLGQG